MRSLFGLALLAATTVNAFAQPDASAWRWEQATPLERQSYSCAALMMVLTTTPDQPEYQSLNKSAMVAGMVLNAVGAEESAKRLRVRVNNGFVHTIRDSEMKVAAASWQVDRPKTVKRFWDCLVWGTSSVQALQSEAIKNPSEIVYPLSFPPIGDGKADQKERFEKWVYASMDTWQKLSNITPSDLKEAARRDVNP
ncbi:hypothetical protein [Methylobacterium iners]|nr:hypothetical protein [Methylobacterium iners]